METYATYCPEDNKLRLYVGRVPREEFLKLRADGWICTPKQREAGGCDFVATWTPSRRDTAEEYSDGQILDEDQGPEDRAADRAERFGLYCDKRTAEATGHADRYDAGPSAHGYQSQARAERAASRHDRIGTRATDAWSKAEYWQRRTAGVISHALYKSTPGVRMGRIKTLEAELRKHLSGFEDHNQRVETWIKIAAMTDPDKQTALARRICDLTWIRSEYMHPRAAEGDKAKSLSSLMCQERDPITGAEACTLYLSNHHKLDPEADDWTIHLRLRLAYENQMLEAQGGRAAHVEMTEGGRLGRSLIVKVCKSNVTGRVVSVWIKGSKIQGWTYQAKDVVGADYSLHQIETERLPANAYTPPDEASLAELKAHKDQEKAKRAKIKTVPLINPTDAEADKLQALWNEQAKAEYVRRGWRVEDYKPSTVCRIKQETYSANSKGTYARAEARGLCGNVKLFYDYCGLYGDKRARALAEQGPTHCKIRITSSDGSDYGAKRVIVLTDKPQKKLPAAVWKPVKPTPEAVAYAKRVEALENEGHTTSDAQAIADAELSRKELATA
jgi:hypothetical protein